MSELKEESGSVYAPEPRCESDLKVQSQDDGTLHVHSFVLKQRSGVFRQLDFEPGLKLPLNHSFDLLQTLFGILYVDHPQQLLTKRNVLAVSMLAFKYDMPFVSHVCSRYILNSVVPFAPLLPPADRMCPTILQILSCCRDSSQYHCLIREACITRITKALGGIKPLASLDFRSTTQDFVEYMIQALLPPHGSNSALDDEA
jgi:hypothetical protein